MMLSSEKQLHIYSLYLFFLSATRRQLWSSINGGHILCMGCKKNDQQMIDIGAAPKTCSSYDFLNPQKRHVAFSGLKKTLAK